MRTNEVRFKELGLSENDKRSRDEWMSILADNPILIERPIVVSGDQAVLGRPPENVLELIGCAAKIQLNNRRPTTVPKTGPIQ